MAWPELVDRLGAPVVELFALGFALWRALTWLAPRVDWFLNRHVEFVDSVEENGKKQTECMVSQRDSIAKLAELMSRHDAWERDRERERLPNGIILPGPNENGDAA